MKKRKKEVEEEYNRKKQKLENLEGEMELDDEEEGNTTNISSIYCTQGLPGIKPCR